jgi:hypothetical protein
MAFFLSVFPGTAATPLRPERALFQGAATSLFTLLQLSLFVHLTDQLPPLNS